MAWRYAKLAVSAPCVHSHFHSRRLRTIDAQSVSFEIWPKLMIEPTSTATSAVSLFHSQQSAKNLLPAVSIVPRVRIRAVHLTAVTLHLIDLEFARSAQFRPHTLGNYKTKRVPTTTNDL